MAKEYKFCPLIKNECVNDTDDNNYCAFSSAGDGECCIHGIDRSLNLLVYHIESNADGEYDLHITGDVDVRGGVYHLAE